MLGEDRIKIYCKDILENYNTNYINKCQLILNAVEKKQYSNMQFACPYEFGLHSKRFCHINTNRGKNYRDMSLLCRDCWEVALKADYEGVYFVEEDLDKSEEV